VTEHANNETAVMADDGDIIVTTSADMHNNFSNENGGV